jgi:hypothetical protein
VCFERFVVESLCMVVDSFRCMSFCEVVFQVLCYIVLKV